MLRVTLDIVAIGISVLTAVCLPAGVEAQSFLGQQQRASATAAFLNTAIQQGIEGITLPPASGQSFTYEFNPDVDAFLVSEQLGPTVLRSPQTIGANQLSLRASASYFHLGQTFGPIFDRVDFESPVALPTLPFNPSYTELGLSASANVTLLNFAATYGITNRIELTLNVPVSVVQAHADLLYVIAPSESSKLPSDRSLFTDSPGSTATLHQIQQKFRSDFANNRVMLASNSFESLRASFPTGNQVGVGRISVGGQGLLYSGDIFALAFSTEFFCNSPNAAQFAGSNSPSILPRIIGQANAAKYLRIYTDVGYDYDFDVSELRRFVWNTGISVPLTDWTIDLGFGGSKFDTPVTWTPSTTTGLARVPDSSNEVPDKVTVLDPSMAELSTNYVDFLFGIKLRLAPLMTDEAAKLLPGAVLSGSVSVPVTSGGFQPVAAGTLALEYYF